ncbi:NAD(P)H-binding protein [Piscinibacter sp. XHJ-5]|uniref:NAD(P)H-binding protein n=1 Tax=Piscinibacter sp. XHJ-5 TaxID=3037797 RepID=UPI0024532975|nr:NAD(P)H-binding protein [Piscinibacter sp. XHJ-5]
MKVLVTGATGFIGHTLCETLQARGHEVVGASRRVRPSDAGMQWIAIDLATAQASDWLVHLRRVDAVVNTVGIFRESAAQRFDDIHIAGPGSLFRGCAEVGLRRVVQVSALGADDSAETAYHLTKKAGDDALLDLVPDAVVVQPSLVFGPGGPSARAFLTWASLPALPLPAGGSQPLQPVHVDDVVMAIVVLLETSPSSCRGARVPLVGPQALTLAGYLQALRDSLGLSPAPTIGIPRAWMAAAARIGDLLGVGLLDTSSWRMLERGNAAPADAITALLGKAPRAASTFIEADHSAAALGHAQLGWLLPLLRLSVALVWIVTGIVSMGVFPVEQSLELLARSGVPPLLRLPMLYGAALLDLVLGILTLWPMRRRRWLWITQAGLIAFYTLVITVRLPEFWLHPYGPVLKNLPMLAALLMLAILDRKER